MQQEAQNSNESDMNKNNTIIIISTDYYDYKKHWFELFKDTEGKNIPIDKFGKNGIPEIYRLIRYDQLVKFIAITDENKSAIFNKYELLKEKFEEKDRLELEGKFHYQFYETFQEIDSNEFIDYSISAGFFPNNLTFKKILGHNIFVLPALPEPYALSYYVKPKEGQRSILRDNYIDFLINAWKITYNSVNDPEENTRFIFVLHEKDLGLKREYKENVIKENDFEKQTDLNNYMSEVIKSKVIDGKYDIVVFQHDSMNSPNIAGDFLIKSKNTDNLIKKIEEIISLLKVSWKYWYEKRNEILLKMVAQTKVTGFTMEELAKYGEEIMQLKLIDEENVNTILGDYAQKTPIEIKAAFDAIFEKARISSIFSS